MYRICEKSNRPVAVWLLLCIPPLASSADEFPAVDCVIGPYQIIELGSAVPGVIDRVLVERSDFVRKGQVIAVLADGVERAAVALATARAQVEPEINVWEINVQYDERRKTRVHSLHDSKLISDDSRDEADREVELSTWKLQQALDLKTIRRRELERAEEQLKQKTIVSPIDGFILEKYKLAGEYVESQPIVKIAQLSPLNVEAIVPIELYGKILLGMGAVVRPETLAIETKPALVTVVDRAGDAGSGTFGVRLELPNPGYELPAGLKCDLRFVEQSVVATTPPPSKPWPFIDQVSQSEKPLVGVTRNSDDVLKHRATDFVEEETAEPSARMKRKAVDPSELRTSTADHVDNIKVSDAHPLDFHPIRIDHNTPQVVSGDVSSSSGINEYRNSAASIFAAVEATLIRVDVVH